VEGAGLAPTRPFATAPTFSYTVTPVSAVESAPFRESHVRSLLKGLTWRFVATGTTIGITYAVTGKIDTAIKVGAIEFLAKIVIYYMHERAWQLVPRGRVRSWYGRR